MKLLDDVRVRIAQLAAPDRYLLTLAAIFLCLIPFIPMFVTTAPSAWRMLTPFAALGAMLFPIILRRE